MSDKHISEVLSDVLISRRNLEQALEDVAESRVKTTLQLACQEEMKRLQQEVSATWFSLNRLIHLAGEVQQKEPQ